MAASLFTNDYRPSTKRNLIRRKKILVTGRVQGVGFRPAVYRLATRAGLAGRVFNDAQGVTIEVQGAEPLLAEFLRRLQSGSDLPPLAQIRSVTGTDIDLVPGEETFTIGPSSAKGTALSQVTADIATCRDCLSELKDPNDLRYRYPFINCTNCGPRYSIIQQIPYDRPNTTMAGLQMCDKCAAQYGNVKDRRFHAQPVACPACGPQIRLTDPSGSLVETGTDKVISQAALLLKAGKIVAIKGIGGYHLAVDACNDEAVLRLRQRKHRDHKPFAMMAASVEQVARYAVVSAAARQILESPQAPIVLLSKRDNAGIAPAVAPGVNTYAFMLCYAPLHHLLFAEGISALVMTSGNISDEPLICKDALAFERLGQIADAFLVHNREIHRQVDDSIIHFVDDQPVLLRRARGYVPTPILMPESSPRHILAAGADLKNTFCLAKDNQLICSEHIGDLEDAEVYHHYVKSVEHLRSLFEVEPEVVVCDLHPGYLSTQYAQSLMCLRVIQVQHHWAHIASVLAEHGLAGPVIGIECDGTGYGTDGAIWGCECMIASLTGFRRFGHLAYFPLPGGDKASKEAIRPALALLRQTYGDDFELGKFAWLLERFHRDDDNSKLKTQNSKLMLAQIEKGINTVQTSSLGRVFDAVAAMLGLGNYNHFDAQLPMALEAIAEWGVDEHYDFEVGGRVFRYGSIGERHCERSEAIPLGAGCEIAASASGGLAMTGARIPSDGTSSGESVILDLRRTMRQLVEDIRKGASAGILSARFHNTIAVGLTRLAEAARDESGLDTVALSGGVFCNRYLSNRLIGLLKKAGFRVLFNRDFPSNDGGLSLGQAAIGVSILRTGVWLHSSE